jgi:hypothetical protein
VVTRVTPILDRQQQKCQIANWPSSMMLDGHLSVSRSFLSPQPVLTNTEQSDITQNDGQSRIVERPACLAPACLAGWLQALLYSTTTSMPVRLRAGARSARWRSSS